MGGKGLFNQPLSILESQALCLVVDSQAPQVFLISRGVGANVLCVE
jgi:hypothetical protein